MRTDQSVAPPERPTKRRHPRLSRARKLLIGSTVAVYAAVVIGVLTTSWLVRLDWQVMLFRPYKQWPQYHEFLDVWVVLGQRGPTALIVVTWLGWRSYQRRDLRPLLVFGLALLLLNITVGAVKYGLGRLGPHYATAAGSAEMWQGGDIFPSGHTANAVVTWGVLAYVATKHRRTGAVITAALAFTVGMTTVYLGTHWVTDVIAGWTAGVLILLCLPLVEPLVKVLDVWLRTMAVRFRPTRGRWALPVAPSPVAARSSALVAPRAAAEDDSEFTVPAARISGARPAGGAVTTAVLATEPRGHHPVRTHPVVRHDRPGTTGAGTRRARPEQRRGSAPISHH